MTEKDRGFPNCWIRGEMSPWKYRNSPNRLATIKCNYREGFLKGFFDGVDYYCSHPDSGGDIVLMEYCEPAQKPARRKNFSTLEEQIEWERLQEKQPGKELMWGDRLYIRKDWEVVESDYDTDVGSGTIIFEINSGNAFTRLVEVWGEERRIKHFMAHQDLETFRRILSEKGWEI
jgi:hypothetical protein